MLRFIKLFVIWPDPPIDLPTHPPMGRVSLQIINLQTELNYLEKVKIYSILSHLTWPHPLTHWPIKPPTHHPWVGVSLQIINLQTELNYLEKVKTYSIVSHLTWPLPLTHWPTQPPTHLPMGGGVSTNDKSSNRIELSRLGQDLFNC